MLCGKWSKKWVDLHRILYFRSVFSFSCDSLSSCCFTYATYPCQSNRSLSNPTWTTIFKKYASHYNLHLKCLSKPPLEELRIPVWCEEVESGQKSEEGFPPHLIVLCCLKWVAFLSLSLLRILRLLGLLSGSQRTMD